MKKLNLLFTAILLLCCAGNAKAEEVTIDGINYDVITDTKQATVIWDRYYYGDIVIPSEITYNNVTCSVTSIEHNAFNGCSGLTSITIPNSVTSIGYGAFNYCPGLTSIVVDPGNTKYDSRDNCNAIIETESNTLITGCKNTVIPNSVTSIGDGAFGGCTGLTSITIPNSVTSIGEWAFYYCSGLKSVTIGNGVTSIGNSAFEGCSSLASIVIPNSVTSIGNEAFYGCHGLTSVTIPNSVTSIGSEAFRNCSKLTSVTIGNSVTSIGSSAFSNCYGLTSVTIPNSVTSIGEYAFFFCFELTSVTIGNSVTSIGDYAFEGCEGLKTVINFSNLTFSEGTNDNGYVAYYADKVINVPNGSIEGDYIFGKPNNVNTLLYYLGNETELTLPADYKGESYVIGENVFKDNKTITSIEIPNSVTSIGNGAFYGCYGLESIVVDPGNTRYDSRDDCNSIIETESNTLIAGCKNTIIPNSVTSIGNEAFGACTGLTSITIPNSVTSIGESAFANCDNITDIKVMAEKPIRSNANIFSNAVYDNATLYVPTGTKSLYEKREPWNMFFYIQEIENTGIEDINAENENVKTIYDLHGRRIENPTTGFYIINGKKTFVK